jgi:hypothetical protein
VSLRPCRGVGGKVALGIGGLGALLGRLRRLRSGLLLVGAASSLAGVTSAVAFASAGTAGRSRRRRNGRLRGARLRDGRLRRGGPPGRTSRARGPPQTGQRGTGRPRPRRRARRGSRRARGTSPGRTRPCRATGGPDVLAGAQVVDELDRGVGRLVVEELPVRHDDRREVTGGVALDALERDQPVVGGLVVPDAQVLGDGLPDRVAAHDRAQRVGADADGVAAVGVALVLGVEGGHTRDLGRGQVEQLGAQVDAAPGDVAVNRLHQVQHRQQRRALLRVAGDDLRGVGAEAGLDVRGIRLLGLRGHGQVAGGGLQSVVLHQRSTPPITGSIWRRRR